MKTKIKIKKRRRRASRPPVFRLCDVRGRLSGDYDCAFIPINVDGEGVLVTLLPDNTVELESVTWEQRARKIFRDSSFDAVRAFCRQFPAVYKTKAFAKWAFDHKTELLKFL